MSTKLTWVEDTKAGTLKRHDIRSFVAIVNPVVRFSIVGIGPECAEAWYPYISTGVLFRKLRYLTTPPVGMTLEAAKQACANHPIPDV